jgi:dsRNA-gated channel SID-1
VAIFYALPVLQLVIIYQRMLNDTGDQDLCYYNFLCTHPLGDLTDFNHVYSNLGYVLLGLLFIILTARKDTLKRKAEQQNDRIEKVFFFSTLEALAIIFYLTRYLKFYGIPQHFGLYYAMGAALMVEGVLSACYHICPSRANFQFGNFEKFFILLTDLNGCLILCTTLTDTTFMYVISMLCMLKIYQTRHPDINAEAHAAFSVLAIVVLLGVVPVFEDSLAFRIIFTAIHLLTCLALGIHIYYMGLWKLGNFHFSKLLLQ